MRKRTETGPSVELSFILELSYDSWPPFPLILLARGKASGPSIKSAERAVRSFAGRGPSHFSVDSSLSVFFFFVRETRETYTDATCYHIYPRHEAEERDRDRDGRRSGREDEGTYFLLPLRFPDEATSGVVDPEEPNESAPDWASRREEASIALRRSTVD